MATRKKFNMTRGDQNLVGYHGNVVMSKWPIIKSEVVRLHPLYDHLYEKKTAGQARGERKLGGRMALFELIWVTSLSSQFIRTLVRNVIS